MNNLVLTENQQKGLELLKEFINSNNSKFFLLKGYAGTGKSTLVNEFINWYIGNNSKHLDNIAITAPTNKAVKVLKRLSKYKNVDYKTLHSLLAIRPRIDDNGVEVFEKDYSVQSTIFNYGCLIVDESSMIDDYIFDLLVEEAYGMKIIFVGDGAQVPPVNMVQSKPFILEVQEKLDFRVFQLNEIIRQAKDNPIIKTSMSIRQGVFERIYEDSRDETGTGVFQLDNKNKEEVFSLMKEAFCGSEFSNNSDYAKVIAWRNVTVDSFNKIIRNFLYYDGVNKIVENEKLILNRPITEGKETILFVNDDLIVKELKIGNYSFFNKTVEYYECLVEKLEEPGKYYTIKIVHENSEKVFQSICNSLKNIALKKPKKERSKAWKAFYDFKDIFSEVSYSYAISVHKSQGSTYNKAFVCYSDIILNQKVVEMQRILYTACTRPSETLFIL